MEITDVINKRQNLNNAENICRTQKEVLTLFKFAQMKKKGLESL
jgi:hypothetical protein